MVESRERFHSVPDTIEHERFLSIENCSSRSPPTSSSSPDFYEPAQLSTPTVDSSGSLLHSAGHSDNSPESLHGNARGPMSESSPPDHSNTGSNQHRSRSQQGNVRRPLGQRSSQAPSSSGAFPRASSENVRGLSPVSFQGGSMSYAPANVQYSQRPGFLGQYPLSAQSTPIPMAHGPTHYGYSPSPYHHPVGPENTMHSNYPPMLQPPPGTIFPYQQHSPDGNSSAHLSQFPVQRGTPMYAPPQLPISSQASPQIPATPGSNNRISPSYVGSSPFHSLQYSSPMTPSPYTYPPHSLTHPVYHSQYPPHPTLHRYPPSGEAEPQFAWYYLHHGPAPPSPYESGPPYQARFPTPYATLRQQEAETYQPPPPTHLGSTSPNIRPESQASADSHHVYGTRPGIYNPAQTPAGSSSGFNKPHDKPIVRRSYHPNPPAHRSEWVMWAGNVPSDATHDELWRFFNQQYPERPAGSPEGTGVLSIFLISRSSCSFVNYKNDFFLQEAVSRFNGVPLRSSDSRCPRLVCRVRRLDDDLKAGVGGQRGMGIHTKWITEQKGKQREADVGIETSDMSLSSSPVSLSERMAAAISTVSMSSTDDNLERRQTHAKHSSSSGSYTSTNSSFLARHFPKRYFILKSLTQHDLDLSVETGLWATQRHNEEILDQAFRTSKDVYLIFGANKSGEFYGYARMVGPVRRGQQRVSWASRSPQSSTSRSSQSPLASRSKSETFFHPSDLRLVESSPLPVCGVKPEAEGIIRHSAPAMLGEPYQLPRVSPVEKFSSDQGLSRGPQRGFHLDNTAPQRAMRHQEPSPSVKPQGRGGRAGPPLQSVDETEEKEIKVEEDGRQPEERKGVDSWGDSFALEWLSTLRLPFHRIRDFRNPWNHDREIKVSRDGTELEPSVGERLLGEWEMLAKELQAQASSSTG